MLVESDREVPVSAGAQAAVRAALEAAGVEFTNGEQPRVRLRKQRPGPTSIPAKGHLNASNDE